MAEKDTKEEKQLAVSLLTGGRIYIDGTAAGDKVTIKHEYVGIGPLLVPCTRGEQKALSGDYALQIFIPDPVTGLDVLFLTLIPAEVYDVLFEALPPPASAEDYQKFQDDRATKLAKMVVSATPSPIAKSTDVSRPALGATTTKPVTKSN